MTGTAAAVDHTSSTYSVTGESSKRVRYAIGLGGVLGGSVFLPGSAPAKNRLGEKTDTFYIVCYVRGFPIIRNHRLSTVLGYLRQSHNV